MSDLRIITIGDDGYVDWTPHRLNIPLNPLEEAIQRFMLCLMTTAGTMIDAPSWGGSAMRLYLKTRTHSVEDTKKQVADVIQQTMSSLTHTEPSNTPYSIVSVVMRDLVRRERGYIVELELFFSGATSQTIRIPGQTNVAV